MVWLVWRRRRGALLFAVGLAGLLAVAAVVAGATADDVAVRHTVGDLSTALGWLRVGLLFLPLVAGTAAGAGLFGREMEGGTHVLALSQHVSRLRWWVTAMLVAGVPVAVAVTAAAAVAQVALRPFGNLLGRSPLEATAFLTTGVLPGVYTLLAFSVAAAAGLVLRNTLAAVAVAVVVHLAVLTVLGFERYHLLPPVTVVGPLAPDGARSREPPLLPDRVVRIGVGYLVQQGRPVWSSDLDLTDCDTTRYTACLRAAGVTGQFARYQPASRYWPFQAVESAVVLGLATCALGASLWALRRRVH